MTHPHVPHGIGLGLNFVRGNTYLTAPPQAKQVLGEYIPVADTDGSDFFVQSPFL